MKGESEGYSVAKAYTHMQWINVKDELPSQSMVCLVCNQKGWMKDIKAIFYPNEKVFVLYDPNYRESLTLDVTHWFEIPVLNFCEHEINQKLSNTRSVGNVNHNHVSHTARFCKYKGGEANGKLE